MVAFPRNQAKTKPQTRKRSDPRLSKPRVTIANTRQKRLLLDKARQLVEARNHRFCLRRQCRSKGTSCVACARQVYVMPDPGFNGAAIVGNAIAETALASRAVELLLGPSSLFKEIHNEQDSG
jgi:hypothetical protein